MNCARGGVRRRDLYPLLYWEGKHEEVPWSDDVDVRSVILDAQRDRLQRFKEAHRDPHGDADAHNDARWRHEGDVDADGNDHAGRDADSDGDADPDSDTDADSDADPHADADANPDPDEDPDEDPLISTSDLRHRQSTAIFVARDVEVAYQSICVYFSIGIN